MSESLRFEGDSRQRRRRGVLAQADSLAPSLPIINPDRPTYRLTSDCVPAHGVVDRA